MELPFEYYLTPTKASKISINDFATLFVGYVDDTLRSKNISKDKKKNFSYSGNKVEAAPYYPIIK